MGVEQLAFVRGWADTGTTLDRWNRTPAEPLRAWAPLALGIAVLLLLATWARAQTVLPDPARITLPGVDRPAQLADLGFVLARNGMVLALHALACVAGFIAG